MWHSVERLGVQNRKISSKYHPKPKDNHKLRVRRRVSRVRLLLRARPSLAGRRGRGFARLRRL